MALKDREMVWKTEYEKEVFAQTNPYLLWQEKWEKDLPEQTKKDCFVINREDYFTEPFVHWKEFLMALAEAKEKADYLILGSRDGEMALAAETEVSRYFENHPEIMLLYGDEDLMEPGKKYTRNSPWFKPDWSPDTLKSFCYFGNFVAIRTSFCLKKIENIEDSLKKDIRNYWDFLLYLCKEESRVGHIERVLFHSYKMKQKEEISYPLPKIENPPKVSVIIPSKDHPFLLEQCLASIADETEYPDYEIIVVDNGSSPENKECILELKKKYSFVYLYEEMEFNFSRMCNIGAKDASGEVLLFLNDDITAFKKDWMQILAFQAMAPKTGAVGAKLYYPKSRRIQHAGITNMTVGPVHKMGGMEDEESIYHARNKANHNVIAVTAACLAVRKEVFTAVGGFCEALSVAYNDVDLGFTLWEMGYYNVQRNDATLYHHESISRGIDETPEKIKRLKKERKLLYERHPGLYGKDPFYSRHLVQERLDGDFSVEYQYPHEDRTRMSKVVECEHWKENFSHKLRKILRKPPIMLFHIDTLREEGGEEAFIKREAMFYLEGWLSATDTPAYQWERSLILKAADGNSYEIELFSKLRRDTKAVLPEQDYALLSGVTAKIIKSEIAPGTYEIGYCLKHKATGKRYVMYDRENKLVCQN